jgi:rhodanese-related sulfurtransferase
LQGVVIRAAQGAHDMASHTVRTITAAELEQHLRDDVGLHAWNVLTDEWFKGELIPGSRRVPLDHLGEAALRSSLSIDVPIVVYCAGPSCPQAPMAAEQLATLGYSHVTLFEGGLEAWSRAGHRLMRMDTSR